MNNYLLTETFWLIPITFSNSLISTSDPRPNLCCFMSWHQEINVSRYLCFSDEFVISVRAYHLISYSWKLAGNNLTYIYRSLLTPTLLPSYTESDLESPMLMLESSCFWKDSTDILDSAASVMELHPPQSTFQEITCY